MYDLVIGNSHIEGQPGEEDEEPAGKIERERKKEKEKMKPE